METLGEVVFSPIVEMEFRVIDRFSRSSTETLEHFVVFRGSDTRLRPDPVNSEEQTLELILKLVLIPIPTIALYCLFSEF